MPTAACLLLALVIVATVLLAPPRPPFAVQLERARRREQLEQTAKLARAARVLAASGMYEAMLARRLLTPVGDAAPDPGNPGESLRLTRDVHGAITEQGGRVLLYVNPPDGPFVTHALPVPPDVDDPIDAAAWSYTVSRDTYLELARRT